MYELALVFVHHGISALKLILAFLDERLTSDPGLPDRRAAGFPRLAYNRVLASSDEY
jgi:hypothetical protein